MKLTGLIVALLVATVKVAAAQTADEIVEKHLAAMGGREALGRIRTRVSTGTVTLTTAVGPVSGTVEAFAKAPNKSRTLITLDLTSLGAGKVVSDQRFDGTTGYVIDLSRVKDIVQQHVVSKVDHRNLNLEVEFLRGVIPTTENVIVAFWRVLEPALRPARLTRLVLWETVNHYVEYEGE